MFSSDGVLWVRVGCGGVGGCVYALYGRLLRYRARGWSVGGGVTFGRSGDVEIGFGFGLMNICCAILCCAHLWLGVVFEWQCSRDVVCFCELWFLAVGWLVGRGGGGTRKHGN